MTRTPRLVGWSMILMLVISSVACTLEDDHPDILPDIRDNPSETTMDIAPLEHVAELDAEGQESVLPVIDTMELKSPEDDLEAKACRVTLNWCKHPTKNLPACTSRGCGTPEANDTCRRMTKTYCGFWPTKWILNGEVWGTCRPTPTC